MKNILILILTLSFGSAYATTLCTPIDNAISLGKTAENCANILYAVGDDLAKTWVKTNEHCKAYTDNKDEVVIGLIMMNIAIQKHCFAYNPAYIKQLENMKKQVDMVNVYL